MATYKELRERALTDPEVRAEFERLNREEFALLDAMLAARREAGLSQADVAERMGTKAPAITRLERALATGQHSPSIDTLRKYAAACGKRLVISFA
ncbi:MULTISPECIES: helix-turn-helix transcriptional regulator [Burkholderia]|jgi:ribosome-binding protein aMBF1 (putative translation factor)|uniref:XRE family transcriptional regulator n=1 Tax=Burkholderia lata (strain ATCC 17760 / DSM 23089 / LMG 22485 / NCIMB 9086 / R18194 / 383) TaxID=482957 RepID=A0A6P2H6H2_BURL3|nr:MULTISPECIES: helix-turn-helix transcriptional regulator [Burkholderia]MBN3769129.1 helix-turn-helix transcriptional regulator [Burkholderia sp. Se-20378]MBN3796277.1 helix-turn-helix transcriptional regulator [Burkholderia sp. Ac-20392]VWB05831.1 XRE family transcriptional regulator [Burkholderia lata]VWB12189.1 XRE family transcriptional regulator [Burkholderia lata]VWB45696.1 XRE family transcriptional regulator [Burkholderia lata]